MDIRGLTLGALALVCTPAAARPGLPEAPVGFIWHYPYVDVGTAAVPASGANCMISRAAWRAVNPERDKFDLSSIDRQLAAARAGGYRLILLLECNPFCAPDWVVRKAREAGEVVRDAAGADAVQGTHGSIPSAEGAGFNADQDAFLRAVIGHVRKTDPQRTIAAYQPGVEWWFPPSFRYGPAELGRFRDWLRAKYKTAAGLSAAWGQPIEAFGRADPPKVDLVDLWRRGRAGLASVSAQGCEGAALRDWSAFWRQYASGTFERLAAKVKRLDRSRPTVSFLTLAFSNGSEWDYREWSAMTIDGVAAKGTSLDALGMQLCLAEGDTYRITFGLDTARKYGKPMYVLDLLDFAAGVAIGPRAMNRATQEAIQHGAAGLFYCCWNGAKDFNFHPDWPASDLATMVGDARSAMRFVAGLHPEPDLTLLNPSPHLAPGAEADTEASLRSLMGWVRVLKALGLTADITTFDEIAVGRGRLATHRPVLVPHSPRAATGVSAALRTFAARGGRVAVAGEFARMDELGRPTPLLSTDRFRALPDIGAAAQPELVRQGHAGDTPPQIMAVPSAVSPELVRRAGAELAAVGVAPRRAVVVGDGTHLVSAAALSGAGRRAAYLVNQGSSAAVGVSVRVAGVADAADVWADGHITRISGSRRSGWTEFVLPRFDRACIVRARVSGGGPKGRNPGSPRATSR